jgi:hypothetical protein
VNKPHGSSDHVTWSQVAAFRLSRHHLSKRAPAAALISVVREIGGAQAQILSAAQMSLWARVQDLQVEDVQTALRERTLVKAWCMRRTLHLLSSSDLATFVRGSTGRAERAIRWVRGKGISDRVLERLIDATLSALDQPLTGRTLVERVGRRLGVRTRTIRGGGWGSRTEVPGVVVGGLTFATRDLLHLAAARGVVCSGPGRGPEPTYVRADAWIPRWRDVSREEAERELLRRYLRAFGPAMPADFAAWTGIPLSGVRRIWAQEEADIVPVSVEGWSAAVRREDLGRLKRAVSAPPPVRLLPYFDSFLLGHRAREHLVAARHHKTVYRTQGWIAPVVLAGGRVVGVWAHAWEGDRLRVRVTKFAAVSRRIKAGIREEANHLGRFLGGAGVDVQIA